jgi:GT2 family glycosyltransferase
MPAPVTAIVTAYKRVEQTLTTLRILAACDPAPAEILVHVDGNQTSTLQTLQEQFPGADYLLSEGNLGPGGGRNKLIKAARHELVASFDDDSYPLDSDYFAKVVALFDKMPEAAILNCHAFLPEETLSEPRRQIEWSSDFCGGSCVYRREIFLGTSGYVPLPTAYGMEEVDLALRLHAAGHRILNTGWLRVFHDTNLIRHAHPEVTAGSIANIALLTFLRYPVVLWPLGLAQLARRIAWLVTHGRSKGVLTGICRIPATLRVNRQHHRPLSVRPVWSYLKLRRQPVPVSWPDDLPAQG